jgi:predicted ATPase
MHFGVEVTYLSNIGQIKRFILTGAPGSGKTAVIQALEASGYIVVHESVTDVIAKEQQTGNMHPWEKPDFIDKIVVMQKKKTDRSSRESATL